jgi:hypothetical protein
MKPKVKSDYVFEMILMSKRSIPEFWADISAKATRIFASLRGFFKATEYYLNDMMSVDANGSLLFKSESWKTPASNPCKSSCAGHCEEADCNTAENIIRLMRKRVVSIFIIETGI